VTFAPGYYSEAPPDLVGNLTNCTGEVWRFAPGTYHFDYPGLWDLSSPRVKVVGGVPGPQFTTNTLLGSCDTTAAGVQFVFGGESTLAVTGTSGNAPQGMELCAPLQSLVPVTKQRLSLVGVRNGASAAPTGSGALLVDTSPVSPASPPGPAFTFPERGGALDGASAAAVVPRNRKAVLSGISFEDLDPGSKVTSPQLRLTVGHRVMGGTAKVVLSAGVRTHEVLLPSICPADRCEIDVPTSSLAPAPAWRGINAITAAYAVEGPNAASAPDATALVDGLSLSLSWTEPAVRVLDCGSPTCAFLTMGNNPKMSVHGTAYLPSAKLDVSIHNSGVTVFQRGVVARTIDITMSASSTQVLSPFRLPSGTPFGRRVLFTGKLDGTEAVRACAVYTDSVPAGASTSAFVGYRVAVPRWTVVRTSADTTACP